MERGVGEHHAEVARARRDRRPRRGRRRGAARSRSAARAPSSSSSSAALSSTSSRAAARSAPSARTASPRGACARAASATARSSAARAGEVVAADALDRDDRAGDQQRGGCRERVRLGVELEPVAVDQPSARPAAPGRRSAGRGSGGRAGPRTRRGSAAHISKPAIVVQRPVVRDAADDREPRAAVGAVDERVAVAAVGGVEQLGQAVVAGRRVGGDQRVGLAAGVGLDDPEPAARRRRSSGSRITRSTAASGRRLVGEPARRTPRPRPGAPRPRAGRRARR